MYEILNGNPIESISYIPSDDEKIVQIIEEGIKNKSTLADIEEQVRSTFEGKLGSVTQRFIELNYGERLIQSWKEESFSIFCTYISELSASRDQSEFQELIEALSKVSSFNDCCDFFENSVYSPLIAGFVERFVWMKKEEPLLLDKLKYRCLLELKNQFCAIKDERDLLHEFLAVLKLKDLVNTRNLLLLDNFANCTNTLEGFKNLLSHILRLRVDFQFGPVSTAKDILRLQSAVSKNINKNIFFLLNDFKNLIHSFLQPVEEPQETFQNGRLVLEVKGTHLVCSNVLPQIESYKRISFVEEVRFIGAAVFHVDTNLKADIWHGKNIVIVADELVVSEDSNYEWDVSGKNAERIQWTKPAGQANDGSGLKGADGFNGESGGNVCLLVKVIKNGEHLVIKSLGGKGSRGQDGGKGADGCNGQSLTSHKFKTGFPPVAKFRNSHKVERLKVTLSSISKTLAVIEKCMYGNEKLTCPMSRTQFDSLFNVQDSKDLQCIYVEAKTTEGFRITFSFFFEAWWINLSQAYVLHEGSEGKEGKNGGLGGFGGQKGFSGDIEIPDQAHQQISTICHDLDESENLDGKQGEWGKPGRKGADFGYLDCSMYAISTFPQLFSSSNDNLKLSLNFKMAKSSDRVWCPMNQRYCRITEVNQSERKTDTHKMKQSMKKCQREQQAQRKKTISKQEMKDKYDKQESVYSMHTIENTLEEILTQLAEKIDNEQNVSSHFQVKRHVSYFSKSWSTFESTTKKVNLQEELGKEFQNQNVLCSLQEINDKEVVSKLSVGTSTTCKLQTLSSSSQTPSENLAKHKKKLDVLRQFQKKLEDESSTSIFSIVQNVVQTNVLSVLECENKKTEIEEFLCENSSNNRSRIVELCKNINDECFMSDLLQFFIKEFHTGSVSFQLELGDECLRAVQFMIFALVKFEARKLKEVSLRLVSMKSELSQNKGLMKQKLTESILKDSNHHKIEFEKQVNKDKLLSALYRQFVKKTNSKFDLDQVPDELLHLVKEAFYLCLEKVGPMSSSCREFLSKHFNTNLLVYTYNKGGFELMSNHNPQANSKVHILMKVGKFFKLKVDDKLNELTHHLKTQSMLFNNMMISIASLDETQLLESVLMEHLFSAQAKNSSSFNNQSFKIKITNVIDQDKNVETISNTFESTDDKLLIASRLEKLKLEFIGYEAALSHMAANFSVEGNHLTTTEFCFVINLILKSVLDEPQTSKLVSWIIASNHQTQWIVEIALLRIEIFLKQVLSSELKSKWRGYISNQNEKEKLMFLLRRIDKESTCSVSVECFDEIIFLLGSIPKAHMGLDEIDMAEWKYYLKDKYFASKVCNITDWSNEHLKELSFIFMILENKLGFKMCNTMLDMMEKQKENIKLELEKPIIISTLKTLASSDVCCDQDVLNKLFDRKILDWENFVTNECLNGRNERSLDSLFRLINASENTSRNILSQSEEVRDVVENCISLIDSLSNSRDSNAILKRKQNVQNMVRKLSPTDTTTEEKDHFVDVINDFIDKEEYDKLVKFWVDLKLNSTFLIPFVAKVIDNKVHKKLKLTQMIAVVTILQNVNNTLAQLSTGEGKTLIVVVLCVIKALMAKRVSVLTSSKVLAIRDAKAYQEIFEYFGVEVGHNCSEDIEERKKVYSSCKVVYGELGNFQRDYLLDRFHNRNIRGDFAFDVAIVDEVDSMLLDKASNILYLAHDIPGLNKLESIFIHIWKWINNPQSKNKSINPSTNLATLKESILFDIFGRVTKECIRDFVNSKCGKVVSNTWEFLIQKKVIDVKGNVLIENMCQFEERIRSIPQNCLNIKHLNFLFKRVLNRERLFAIPNYLKPYVDEHLENWIRSGVNALMMQNGKDYVVDVDRSGNSTERNPNIIILDQSTGTDLFNSQWDEALHQFIQLKHGCKLSLLSLKAVYISNVSYLKLSKTLYGLSGTLGSVRERDLLQEIYKKEKVTLDFVTIPTAKAKSFIEYVPILCSFEDWGATICNMAKVEIEGNRSVLIVCDSVNDVLNLKEYFLSMCDIPVHTYTRDYEELTVAKNIDPGHIIIATNLAGRGTDILISKALEDAGGLHEILAYFPDNCRTGEQAYGRVARNGQPGSAQMIIRVNKDILQRGSTQYIDLKKQRDVDEIKRLAEVKAYYESRIVPEENWLLRFEELYEKLRKKPLVNWFESIITTTSETSSVPFDFKSSLRNKAPGPLQKCLPSFVVPTEKEQDDVKFILLQTCLNEWAFWLDRHSKWFSVKENYNELECYFEQLSSTCEALCSEEFDKCIEIIKDPCQIIKLGLVYLDKKSVLSIKLFDKVIKEEPLFSEIALYYRACAKSTTKELNISEIIDDLESVASKLKGQIQSAALTASFIDCMKEYNPSSILQIDSFKEQQLNISKIYNLFLESINSIIGSELSPEMLTLNAGDHQFALKLFNDLIGKNVLTKHTISNQIVEDDLRFAWKYYISPKNMMKLLGPLKEKVFSEVTFFEIFGQMLPSRELFWEELKKNKLLVDEKEYAFLLMQEIEVLDPSLIQTLKNVSEDDPNEDYIQLYDCQLAINQENNKMFDKKTLEKAVGVRKIEFLKSRNVIFFNKKAKFVNITNTPDFDMFDSISLDDFLNIEVPKETALEILNEMESLGIINHNKSHNFSLATHSENIEKLNLLKHKAYNEEVKSLMEFHFAFRIAYEKVQLLSKHSGNFHLPLHASLHKHIIKDLDENSLIKKPSVVTDKDLAKIVSSMYPSSMVKTDFARLLQDQFGEKSVTIVSELIEQNFLIQTSTISDLMRWNKKYLVNTSKLNNGQQMLEGKFANESLTLVAILSDYHRSTIKFQANREMIIKILENSKGSIYSIDTPKLSLTPLYDALLNAHLPVSELPLFSLNGFEQMLILEEKKWTWRMKVMTFAVVTFGLAQVALGVACEMTGTFALAGAYFMSEGISDLIFAGNCLTTGHCTWRSYTRHKLISLVFNTVSSAGSIYKALKANFGENIAANISFDTIKSCIGKVASKAKACWESVWAASTPVKKEIMKRLVREVAVHSVKATAWGVATGAIYSQLHNLGDFLTDAIYSKVNEIIATHRVSTTILQVRQTFCERDSERLIKGKYIECITTHRHELETTFIHLVELVKIALRLSGILGPQTLQNYLNQDNMFCYNLFSLLEDTKKEIENCFKLYSHQFTIVNNVMNDLENELLLSIQKINARGLHQPSPPDQEVLNEFQSKIVKVLQEDMKQILSDQLMSKVISPVLDYTANVLIAKSSQNSVMNSNLKLKDIEADRLEKMQDIYREIEGNPKLKPKGSHLEQNRDLDYLNYNESLLEMFKKQRNVPIFSEILKTNLAVDSNFLESFCSVIPLALRKEGINLPDFQLIIEKDGIQHVISTQQNITDNIPTVVFSPDAGIITNIKKNNFLVMEVFDAIHNQLSETCPILKAFNTETLRSTVAKAIEEESSIQEKISFGTKQEISIQEINIINVVSEQRLPYQHNKNYGRWTFSPAVDVDLRKDNELINLSKSEDHILEGFKTALTKINQKIYKHLKRPLELALDNFSHSNYEITSQRSKLSTSNFECFPSKYELEILLPIHHTGNKLEKFTVSMTLVNPSTKVQPREPMGPHVLYEVNPVDMKLLQYGVRGHVLLPFECREETFSVENCHSAGDLIRPFPQVIVLGDSTLKNLGCKTFYYKKHSSLAELKTICESLAEQIKELKCACVIHFGTSIDVKNLPPEHVINQIAELVIDMKAWNVRIAIIGFTTRNPSDSVLVDTLNQPLQDFCKGINIEYLCPGQIFKCKYIKNDGSLNRKGRREFRASFIGSKVIDRKEEIKSRKAKLEDLCLHIRELD